MRTLAVAVLATCAIFFACSNKSPEEPQTEIFTGELEVDRGLDSVGGQYTDTISLVLDDPYYTLFFVSRHARLCDSEGKTTGFGTPIVKFSPTHIFTGSCDSLRIPHGSFAAVFYGDTSAVLTQTDYVRSIKYELRLKK
jgi:hypothetical protein